MCEANTSEWRIAAVEGMAVPAAALTGELGLDVPAAAAEEAAAEVPGAHELVAGSAGAAAEGFGEDASKVQAAIDELLQTVNCQTVTIRKFRRQVASHLGLGKKGLEAQAESVNAMIKSTLAKQSCSQETPAQQMAKLLQELGEEDRTAKQYVYLCTLSRILPETLEASDLKDVSSMTREEVGECVRKAFDDPLMPEAGHAGRKRLRTDNIVKKLVVFLEEHSDAENHFHVPVQLAVQRVWGPAKRTLRERDGLACHFSSSHTQLWSAVRYGFIATLSKPDVDQSPFMWAVDDTWPTGLALPGSKGWSCLFEASQRPWAADSWKACSEQAQKRKAEGDLAAKRARFTKLDLTAIILDRGLTTKAAILEYCQNNGSEAMQLWVHQNQKKLKEFLAEAQEWGEARAAAQAERLSDWELLCQTADRTCCHGDECCYAEMATSSVV